MMKKLWKPALLILLCGCCLLVAACSSSGGPVNYSVAGATTEIPSITSVVGEREDEYSKVVSAKSDGGIVSVLCNYKNCEDVAGDIDQYCKKLTADCGFTLTKPFDGSTAILTAPSDRAGESIRMTISAEDNRYSILTEVVGDSDSAASESASSENASSSESTSSIENTSSENTSSIESSSSPASNPSSGIDTTAA